MSTSVDLDLVRRTLAEDRSKLVRQIAELGASENGDLRADYDFGDSFADAAAITAERTEILGIVDALKRQLEDVDAVMAKIDDGTYGVCESCGKEIGVARLQARPTSRFCVECKARRA